MGWERQIEHNEAEVFWGAITGGGARTNISVQQVFYFILTKAVSKCIPHFKYIVKIHNDFDQSCYGLICYYEFSIVYRVLF